MKKLLEPGLEVLQPEELQTYLEANWLGCQRCELCKTRFGEPVFGEGDFRAKVLLVGEAPGTNEEEERRPFVGKSGQYLMDLLAMLGIERESVYITNAVMCRPPDYQNPNRNRAPADHETKACRERLYEEIYHVDPLLIIALGAVAAKTLGGASVTLQKHLGEIVDIKIPMRTGKGNLVYPMLVTHHPAGVLRRGAGKGGYPDFDQLFRSDDPDHQLLAHLLLGAVSVAYADAIQANKDDIPAFIKELAPSIA